MWEVSALRTVPLGRTGVMVSAFGFGMAHIGSRIDEPASFRLLDQYAEAGGSFFDTANIYATWVPGCCGGESETTLGRWMKSRGNRDGLFVCTKLGFAMPGIERGLRAAQIEAECEKSLRRLGTDRIDLYYAHVDDRETPLAETLAAFDRLVGAGKVRFIGASNYMAWRLEEAAWVSATRGFAQYCCVQQHYSYIRGRNPNPNYEATPDLLDYCRVKGLALVAYSPLLGGAYASQEALAAKQLVGPEIDARLAALREVARTRGATPNQVVLAWLAAQPGPVIPLIAAGSAEHLAEDLAASEIALSDAETVRLNEAASA